MFENKFKKKHCRKPPDIIKTDISYKNRVIRIPSSRTVSGRRCSSFHNAKQGIHRKGKEFRLVVIFFFLFGVYIFVLCLRRKSRKHPRKQFVSRLAKLIWFNRAKRSERGEYMWLGTGFLKDFAQKLNGENQFDRKHWRKSGGKWFGEFETK